MKKSSAMLGALTLFGVLAGTGCGGASAVRSNWEAELTGALSLDCHNIDHVGYGLHYDVILTDRRATPRAFTGVPTRTMSRASSGQHGE